jgi:hypothetical protein
MHNAHSSKRSTRHILTIVETLPTTSDLLPRLLLVCAAHGEALSEFDGVWRWSFGAKASSNGEPTVVVVVELQDLSGYSVYNKSAVHKRFLKAVKPLTAARGEVLVVGDVEQFDIVSPQV